MKYKQPTPRQVKKARKRRHREFLQIEKCYCVCHSDIASRASCKHCHGNNAVGRYHFSRELVRSLRTIVVTKGL